MPSPLTPKQAAVDFLEKVIANKIDEAYALHVDPACRHHNPYFDRDIGALKAGMQENAHTNPQKIFEIQHVIHEGDLVAVHSRLRQETGGPAFAVVHLFRFRQNRVVEFWDVCQPEPAENVNENGMF